MSNSKPATILSRQNGRIEEKRKNARERKRETLETTVPLLPLSNHGFLNHQKTLPYPRSDEPVKPIEAKSNSQYSVCLERIKTQDSKENKIR